MADTPGIREVGLWGVDTEDLDLYFPEMDSYLGECKYNDCIHLNEPDCAVTEAVNAGEISPVRYSSYVVLKNWQQRRHRGTLREGNECLKTRNIQIGSLTRRARTSCNTLTILSIGIRGEKRRWRSRGVENKPILLSVGYAACHWCHVMEHESFENEQIASIMNEHFINIKVDREERPDLDEIYMNAVQMLTGSGGWPMTMFLAPDLKPFYGGTYFPP